MTLTTKMTTKDEEAVARFEKGIDPNTATVRDRSAVAEIEQAAHLRREVEELVDGAVQRARENGVTWTEIGAALGVSHQAAMKRYKQR